jgi:protein-S-isoprenylcysteine O-methyltransferase Ste14
MERFAGQFVALCWLTFFLVWLIAAFRTNRPTTRRGQPSRWWFWLLAVGVVPLLRQGSGLFTVRLWSFSPVLGVVADGVTLAGLVVALWARTTLGDLWSSGVVLKEEHAIIDHGPYHYVRHPIYSGVLLMVLGTTLLSGSLLAFLVAFFLLWVKSRQEERLLTEHLREAYSCYRSRVKSALIPGVL